MSAPTATALFLGKSSAASSGSESAAVTAFSRFVFAPFAPSSRLARGIRLKPGRITPSGRPSPAPGRSSALGALGYVQRRQYFGCWMRRTKFCPSTQSQSGSVASEKTRCSWLRFVNIHGATRPRSRRDLAAATPGLHRRWPVAPATAAAPSQYPDVQVASHEDASVAKLHGARRAVRVVKPDDTATQGLARLRVARDVHEDHPAKLLEVILQVLPARFPRDVAHVEGEIAVALRAGGSRRGVHGGCTHGHGRGHAAHPMHEPGHHAGHHAGTHALMLVAVKRPRRVRLGRRHAWGGGIPGSGGMPPLK